MDRGPLGFAPGLAIDGARIKQRALRSNGLGAGSDDESVFRNLPCWKVYDLVNPGISLLPKIVLAVRLLVCFLARREWSSPAGDS